MPPESTLAAERAGTWAEAIPGHWRGGLVRLALGWMALFALTFADWKAMAGLWWNVSTYNHILFVPVIIGWLVWGRSGALARIEPQAWWPALVPLTGALVLWVVSRLGGLDIGSQAAAVIALQSITLAALGVRVGAALLFPLAYALFLVPFGDELVPALQMITAKMTIALTHWSGVIAVVDGVFIDTPAGLFEVAEECSGVKFLIAMIALGVLVAQCCFLSWRRRAIFMAAAIALPILANGIRAWGTIYIAQSQGIEFAAGFDHIVYGWVFFGVVIALLLGFAWRWFDRDPEAVQIDADAIMASPLLARLAGAPARPRAVMAAVLAAIAAAALWHAGAAAQRTTVPESIVAPGVPGWAVVNRQDGIGWQPRAGGADRRLLAHYRDADGRSVDVFLALYATQDKDTDATGFGEGALPPDTDWRWLAPASAPAGMRGEALFAQGSVKRVAWTRWSAGDFGTASAAKLKLAVMRDRALFAMQPVTTLIISAEGADAAEVEQRLAAFAEAMGSPDAWMDRATAMR